MSKEKNERAKKSIKTWKKRRKELSEFYRTMHDQSMVVICPVCKQAIGKPCVNTKRKIGMTRAMPHNERLQLSNDRFKIKFEIVKDGNVKIECDDDDASDAMLRMVGLERK